MFKEETLSEKFIKKGFRLYFMTFFIAPTGYIMRVITSNTLSIEEVGVMYSLIGLMSFISIYNDLGLNESLRYFLPKYWVKKDYNNFKTVIYISGAIKIIISIFMTLGFYFLSGFIATSYLHSPWAVDTVKIFSLFFLATNIYEVLNGTFSALQDTFNEKFIELLKTRTTSIVAIIIYFTGTSSLINYTHSWLDGLIISVIISGIIFFVKYKKQLNLGRFKIEKTTLRKYFKYSLWAFVGANVATLFTQLDQQVVVYLLGPEQAGYYSNYLSLMNIYTTFLSPILGFIFAVTSELHSKEQHEKIGLIKNFLYKYVGLFCLALGAFFSMFGEEIAAIFYGEKFIFSGHLLQFSGIFIIINAIYAINFYLMAGIGLIRERVKIIAYSLIINLVSMLIFVHFLGIYGALIGMIIGRTVIVYMSHKALNKETKLDIDYKFFILNIIYIGLFTAIGFFIRGKIFILKDIFRMQNLVYLAIIGIIYFIYMAIVNYKEIIFFKNELKNFKNTR